MKGRHRTKADDIRFEKIRELGCIVCLLEYGQFRPCVVHHIDGKTKPNAHQKTIGLCEPGHHQGGSDEGMFISRHPYKARFETSYGSEQYLLEQTNMRIAA